MTSATRRIGKFAEGEFKRSLGYLHSGVSHASPVPLSSRFRAAAISRPCRPRSLGFVMPTVGELETTPKVTRNAHGRLCMSLRVRDVGALLVPVPPPLWPNASRILQTELPARTRMEGRNEARDAMRTTESGEKWIFE